MPSPADAIEKALMQLKAGALLGGWRGKAKGDIKAAVAAIEAIQGIALDWQDKLEDLEINPLMIRPEGKGAVAVDALIRLNP
jgi:succinyl-CoA synthetase beta subunit